MSADLMQPNSTWRSYYRSTSDRPPRETLCFALDRFDAEAEAGSRQLDRFAIDLGCGGGRDTIELLRREWRVLAVDAETDAIDSLRSRPDLPDGYRLQTRVARFEDAALPNASLINSSFALPLCPPETFAGLWSRIVEALPSGGRFAGQLFGDRDSWADAASGKGGITFLTRSRLEALLAGLTIELFREEEDESTTPRGETKHWHLYHVVARKP